MLPHSGVTVGWRRTPVYHISLVLSRDFFKKKLKKIFLKTLDKIGKLWYNVITVKEEMNMKKFFERTLMAVCAALFIWGFLSWVDVVADNNKPNPTHSEYNLFVIMNDWARDRYEEKNLKKLSEKA